MQAPDRLNVPLPAECEVGHYWLHRRIMQSTALKILKQGADASPVGRKATK
jgi:hypothetical protein